MRHSHTLFLAAAALVACLLPDVALASSGTGLPWEDPLETLQNSLTGPVAMVIVILAMAAAGFTLIFGGELNDFTRRILMVVLAGAVVLFAGQLIDVLFGSPGAVV